MEIVRLSSGDEDRYRAWLTLFGAAFEEPESYTGAMPSPAYRDRLLTDANFIPLAALENGRLVGALAAYVLVKFEQERSEIYIYDLAVDQAHRRKGVGEALVNETRRIASDIGAWVVYGLGSESENLPAYMVMLDGRIKSGSPAYGSGFLPAMYQGTVLRSYGPPILNVNRPTQFSAA